MNRHSDWRVIEYHVKHHIAYIEDLDLGGPSVTNDAEYVYNSIRTQLGAVRVVYLDSDREWWEISMIAGNEPGDWRVVFKPWHGLVWDILNRKE